MNICVIGGTGHIGGFLTPFLVEDGHDVTVVSTGRKPAPDTPPWRSVTIRTGTYARNSAEWTEFITSVGADVIVDILGADVPGLYNAVRGTCRQLVVCGSLWMFGFPKVVPTPEITQGPCEFEGYAQRYEELCATRDQAARDGLAFAALMPSNICGPGKIPLDARGGRGIEEHRSYARGEPVVLPAGCNTLISPCDASDIATGFRLAVRDPDAADGEILNVGAAYALTAPQLVAAYAEIYDTTIPIEEISWDEFLTDYMPDPGANFHFRAHMCPDISKLRTKLGYEPRYTPEETMARAVAWMREEGML